MTSKTVLNGLNIFLAGLVPNMCPKKVASTGLGLVPLAIKILIHPTR